LLPILISVYNDSLHDALGGYSPSQVYLGRTLNPLSFKPGDKVGISVESIPAGYESRKLFPRWKGPDPFGEELKHPVSILRLKSWFVRDPIDESAVDDVESMEVESVSVRLASPDVHPIDSQLPDTARAANFVSPNLLPVTAHQHRYFTRSGHNANVATDELPSTIVGSCSIKGDVVSSNQANDESTDDEFFKSKCIPLTSPDDFIWSKIYPYGANDVALFSITQNSSGFISRTIRTISESINFLCIEYL